MPWQHSGVEAKRTWPIGVSPEALRLRWESLLKSKDRAAAFRESTDRLVSEPYAQFIELDHGNISVADLPDAAECPVPQRYGFRSFDRQYILPDGRLIARPRPQLWAALSSSQVFFSTLSTDALDRGPSISVTTDIPDRHYFCGRGGKDILPLFRDAAATQPNLHPRLLPVLSATLGRAVATDDVAAYLYAVLAQPAFAARFHTELATRELRVPLTADPVLFARCIAVGRELLFLHTYGERFVDGQHWPAPIVKSLTAVPSGRMPERFSYDPARRVLSVDGGDFGPVSPGVWDYEVSGLRVVQSWLGYRMKQRKGKKSSPLDDITPVEWGSDIVSELLRLLNLLTRTIEVQSEQAALLDAILGGPLLGADALGEVPPAWRKAPKDESIQPQLRSHDDD